VIQDVTPDDTDLGIGHEIPSPEIPPQEDQMRVHRLGLAGRAIEPNELIAFPCCREPEGVTTDLGSNVASAPESINIGTSPMLCWRSGWRRTTRASGAGGTKRRSS
jgi:hypothetical protein